MNLKDAALQILRNFDSNEIGTIVDTAKFSIEEAYEIQARVASLRAQRGELVIGYKVGCVSPELRESMGIFHPVFGRLFDSEQWQSGVHLDPHQFTIPAIEGELAVRLNKDLHVTDLDKQTIGAAIDSIYVVIEMHNKVFRSIPGAPELLANNALHAGVIQSQEKATSMPDAPGPLRVHIDDVQVARVPGTDLRTTIFDSLRWLANALDEHGHGLQAGQTILCGTISGMHLIDSGARVAVTTENFGSVTMRFG